MLLNKLKKYREEKFKKNQEVKLLKEKKARIEKRNKAVVYYSKITCSVLIVLILGYLYILDSDKFINTLKENAFLILIPLWIYFIILMIIESIRAVFQIFFLGMILVFFGWISLFIAMGIFLIIEDFISDSIIDIF